MTCENDVAKGALRVQSSKWLASKQYIVVTIGIIIIDGGEPFRAMLMI